MGAAQADPRSPAAPVALDCSVRVRPGWRPDLDGAVGQKLVGWLLRGLVACRPPGLGSLRLPGARAPRGGRIGYAPTLPDRAVPYCWWFGSPRGGRIGYTPTPPGGGCVWLAQFGKPPGCTRGSAHWEGAPTFRARPGSLALLGALLLRGIRHTRWLPLTSRGNVSALAMPPRTSPGSARGLRSLDG